MEIFFFITGVLVSIVSVMVYNYSRLDKKITLLLKENETLSERNINHNTIIQSIQDTLTSDEYQTTKDLISKYKDTQDIIKKLDQSLNTLANKSNTDIKNVNDNVQDLKNYVKELTNMSNHNREY